MELGKQGGRVAHATLHSDGVRLGTEGIVARDASFNLQLECLKARRTTSVCFWKRVEHHLRRVGIVDRLNCYSTHVRLSNSRQNVRHEPLFINCEWVAFAAAHCGSMCSTRANRTRHASWMQMGRL